MFFCKENVVKKRSALNKLLIKRVVNKVEDSRVNIFFNK